MRIPSRLRTWLLRRLMRATVVKRPPDFVIGGRDNPYLRRWWVIPRNRFCNVYFHHFLRSDEDRALHDHPWWSMSVILDGGYWEHVQGRDHPLWRPEGYVGLRSGRALHRVELPAAEDAIEPGRESVELQSAWTLFITGPRYREWGFQCGAGWRHHLAFVDPARPGEVGRGCD